MDPTEAQEAIDAAAAAFPAWSRTTAKVNLNSLLTLVFPLTAFTTATA